MPTSPPAATQRRAADRRGQLQLGRHPGREADRHHLGRLRPDRGVQRRRRARPARSDASGRVLSAPTTGVERTGMFGVHGSGDTSGYGLLVSQPYTPPRRTAYGGPEGVRGARDERSSGSDRYGQFDEVADALAAAMAERSIPPQALLQTTVANERDHLLRRPGLPHRVALGAARRRVAAVRIGVIDLGRRLRREGVPAGCTWSTS